VLALTVDPVDGGLEVLKIGIPKSRIDVVLIIAVGVEISLEVVGVSLEVVLGLFDVKNLSVGFV